MGFESAIQELRSREVRAHGIDIAIEMGELPELPVPTERTVFKIVQR